MFPKSTIERFYENYKNLNKGDIGTDQEIKSEFEDYIIEKGTKEDFANFEPVFEKINEELQKLKNKQS